MLALSQYRLYNRLFRRAMVYSFSYLLNIYYIE